MVALVDHIKPVRRNAAVQRNRPGIPQSGVVQDIDAIVHEIQLADHLRSNRTEACCARIAAESSESHCYCKRYRERERPQTQEHLAEASSRSVCGKFGDSPKPRRESSN